MRFRIVLSLCLGAALFAAPARAQETKNEETVQLDRTPVYRVHVIQRTTKAVNYRHRGGTTQVDFRGTDLMPKATGQAKVEGKSGRLEVRAELKGLRPARTFGPEYLTYVLWAITPEGRPVNLGEVLPNGDGDAKLTVTTDLQAFGMIVTAEPYFAVTRPSNLVVAENIYRSDTKGQDYPIDAKFDLLERGEYTVDIPVAQLPATTADPKTPLELLEARNAVAIAKATGAEHYAPDALAKAQKLLATGEDYLSRKQGRTPIGTVARAAAQSAEDARLLTIRRKQEERATAERRAIEEREEQARQQAAQERERATQAQLDAEAEARRRQQAEEERLAAERAKADADRARQEAESAAERARLEREQAEASRQAAVQQQQQLEVQTQQAREAAARAEREREDMRSRLLAQLNQVLQTKDTARGLIVNMSDVLFDTGKATLRPGARERLAKVAGIILAYPDLHLQIEGHTDSVGSDAYNLTLSERRAQTVRDYLVKQGVPMANIMAQGFGKSQPIASNATPSGRQMNRRVELVVSGEAIGTNVGPAFRVGGGQNAGAATTGGVSGAAATGAVTSQPSAGAATTTGTVAAPATRPGIAGSGAQTAQPAPTPPASSTVPK